MRSLPIIAASLGVALGFVASALAPGPATPLQAGTALRMDLEEVFQRSDLVVEGTVLRARSGELEDGTIYTDWDLEVDRTFWGEHVAERTVRLPGGHLASGRGMVLPGMPRVAVGEDVVLMLTPESRGGVQLPVGLSQGKYRVVTAVNGERIAMQTGDHVTLVSADRIGSPRGLARLAYGELIARLEAARAQRRALDAFGVAPSGDPSEALPTPPSRSSEGR